MRRVVIDTDGGVDDALALLFALASPEIRLEAITTVHGNVPVESAIANVNEVLHIAGRDPDSVPLAQGCAGPLSHAPASATDVHGSDGLGGWLRVAPKRIPAPEPTAAQTILSLARQFPGEIALVAIGPLTNAAAALRDDPAGFRGLQQIMVMGGAVFERGNVTSAAEFNFFADPLAAREVVNSGVLLKLVGLDVTHQVVFTRERLDALLGDRSDLRARFLRCICGRLLSFYKQRLGRDLCFLHDPLAVGVALDPSLVETKAMSIDVETKGELTRGMTVPERRPWLQTTPNIDVCLNVDAARFIDLFCSRVA